MLLFSWQVSLFSLNILLFFIGTMYMHATLWQWYDLCRRGCFVLYLQYNYKVKLLSVILICFSWPLLSCRGIKAGDFRIFLFTELCVLYRIKMYFFFSFSLTLRQNLSLVSLSSLLKDLCGEDICLRISFLLKGKESLSSLSNLNFLQSLITPLGPKREVVRWETSGNKKLP